MASMDRAIEATQANMDPVSETPAEAFVSLLTEEEDYFLSYANLPAEQRKAADRESSPGFDILPTEEQASLLERLETEMNERKALLASCRSLAVGARSNSTIDAGCSFAYELVLRALSERVRAEKALAAARDDENAATFWRKAMSDAEGRARRARLAYRFANTGH